MSDITKTEFEIIEKGSYKLIKPDDSVAFVWDDSKAIILNKEFNYFAEDDEKSVEDIVEELMTLKAEDRIDAEETFQDYLKNKKDVSAYLGMAAYKDMLPSSQIALINSMGMDLEGNYLTLNLSFEADDVVVNYELYPSPEMEKKMKEMEITNAEFNDALLSYFPKISWPL